MQYYQFHHKIKLPKLDQNDNDNKSLYVIFFFTNIHSCSTMNFDIVNLFIKSYTQSYKKFSIIPKNASDWNKIIHYIFSSIKKDFSDYTFELIKMEICFSNSISISTSDTPYIGKNNIKVQEAFLNKKIMAQLNISDCEIDDTQKEKSIVKKIKNIFIKGDNYEH